MSHISRLGDFIRKTENTKYISPEALRRTGIFYHSYVDRKDNEDFISKFENNETVKTHITTYEIFGIRVEMLYTCIKGVKNTNAGPVRGSGGGSICGYVHKASDIGMYLLCIDRIDENTDKEI